MFSSTSSDPDKAERKKIMQEGIDDIKRIIGQEAAEIKKQLMQKGYDEKSADAIIQKAIDAYTVKAIKECKRSIKEELIKIMAEDATPSASYSK